jgi:hypothetical protein
MQLHANLMLSKFFKTAICHFPDPETCLFYTAGLSQTAQNFAKSHGLTTIWVGYASRRL